MKFKIDENLPVEFATLLQNAGYNADTVHTEGLTGSTDSQIAAICQAENRIIITLDLGFSDIRAYNPAEYPGIIVIRAIRQDKQHILSVATRLLPLFEKQTIQNKLWIVEERRVRIRG
jgi:predicted nuclease of predicted toxin-antitoxin system